MFFLPLLRIGLYLLYGAFFNYVDMTRWVGGTGNVNGIQRFYPITVKEYVNRVVVNNG